MNLVKFLPKKTTKIASYFGINIPWNKNSVKKTNKKDVFLYLKEAIPETECNRPKSDNFLLIKFLTKITFFQLKIVLKVILYSFQY